MSSCGCRIESDTDRIDPYGLPFQCIVYCPVHVAAPDLLALAARVALHFDGTDAPLGEEARRLIARAEESR